MDATILVVDDDPTIRTLITRVLTRVGYQVQEAEDGLSALAQIALTRPALVLTDLMMPGMKGDALVAQVRQGPDPIPCILMSAYHNDSPLLTVPFLAKPFAIPDLVRLVSETLPQLPACPLTACAPDVPPRPGPWVPLRLEQLNLRGGGVAPGAPRPSGRSGQRAWPGMRSSPDPVQAAPIPVAPAHHGPHSWR